MTKDDILALLGKPMQVRVTSNEKLEETLETAGENDIVLVSEEILYRHDLNLNDTIFLSIFNKREQPYSNEDIGELRLNVYPSLPKYLPCVYRYQDKNSGDYHICACSLHYDYFASDFDFYFNVQGAGANGAWINEKIRYDISLTSDTVTKV